MNFCDMTWLERLLFLKRIKGGGSGHEETTTSNTFVTDMVAPLRKLLLSFAPKQSGSGDPSPDNVRPISGWDGVSVTRCGSNLRGGIDLANDFKARVPSATIDTANKVVTIYVNDSQVTDKIVPNIIYKENTQYTFILTIKNNTQKKTNLRLYYTDSTYDTLPDLSALGTKETLVIVSAPNKTVLSLAKNSQGGTAVIYYDESGVFEGVLTADDFEPYAGQTYSVSFPALGKNLLDKSTMINGAIRSSDGVIDTTVTTRVVSDFIPTLPNTQYTASIESGKKIVSIRSYTSDKTAIGTSSVTTATFTTPSNASYVRCCFGYNGNSTISPSDIQSAQLERGSVPTAYEPYTDTVYGGTLDMVSGVLTACPYYASYNGETLVGEWISDRDVYTPNTSPTTGAQVVNIGGTPTTYQLTPQQINTLIGTNAITTDANVEEIIYLKKAK